VLEADLKRLYFESPRPTPLARQLLENGYELRTGEAGLVRASELRPPAEKMSRARATTARRMRESLGSTAQYTLNASAEATGLLNLRARVKERGAALGLPDININEMVMFCAVRALALAPEVNVEFTDGKISRPDGIHLGFACDTPKGLLVPVVKDAGALTLAGLARRIKELTRQAVEGVLPPDDMTGGTFTVSNLGVYGVESFTPILNPPQAAILGVNSIGLKPVRREGAVVFVEHIGLSLTCDHQVIDGAPGARFLKICREQIEDVEAIAGLEI
jgi:pyruvate dehydrogenase E2 component (dihydrolipoamide acetyltransferase)